MMRTCKNHRLKRIAWLVGAACAACGLLLLPLAERPAAANGAPQQVTPLPLIVVDVAPTPVPITGARLDPPAIEHTDVLLPLVIQAELLSSVPLSAQEANAAADRIREPQEADGRGITTATSPIASGLTLFAPRTVLQVTYLATAGGAVARPVAAAPAVGVVAVVPGATLPVATTAAPAALAPVVAAPTAQAPRTIQSPARLGLPTPVPTASAAPLPGIRDPGQLPDAPVAVNVSTVPKQLTQAVGAAPADTSAASETVTETAIPSARNVPVIVVEPGAASVPLGAPAAEGVAFQVIGADVACNTFNQADRWASMRHASPSDMWSDWYAGWGPFAVDNGLYQAKNVTFSLERTVGPGSNAGPNEHSAKIASNQPYAAGFGSPLFGVPPGALVTVAVNYLIFDHDDHGNDYDWASLGIKADAYGDEARYANGYARGEWATLMNSVVAGPEGRIMVLLQAESPAALNSNIYFDNVRIWIDGAPVVDCAG